MNLSTTSRQMRAIPWVIKLKTELLTTKEFEGGSTGICN